MRAIDTNVLIRYVVRDDEAQQVAVQRLFEECRKDKERIFIAVPVLCEFSWVVERGYGQTRLEFADGLDRLLALDFLMFEERTAVEHALAHYRRGRAGLADYLIGELAAQAGCRDTVTFDRALRGAPGFTILRTK